MAPPTRYSFLACLLLFLCVLPSAAGTGGGPGPAGSYDPASVHLFKPETGAIHSTQIQDIINGPQGEVIFATSFGLSIFNGSWETLHIDRNSPSSGLLDDYVTALAYDAAGRLWIGYPGGIQIYDGRTYSTIRDTELLKSLEIRALQRWDDEMWVATGNAGLHRYLNGTWTWFAPYSPNGPGFFEADSMAVDSADDSLLVATAKEGLWRVTRFDNGSAMFGTLQGSHDPFGQLRHVRRDPLGGGYFFNETTIAHYDAVRGFVLLAKSPALGDDSPAVNDLAVGPDGAVCVATDDGITVLRDGQIVDQLDTFEGFGTIQGIRKVYVDAGHRLWFSTQEEVGYATGNASIQPAPVVMTMTPSPSPTTASAAIVTEEGTSAGVAAQQAGASPLDRIYSAIAGLLPFLPHRQ